MDRLATKALGMASSETTRGLTPKLLWELLKRGVISAGLVRRASVSLKLLAAILSEKGIKKEKNRAGSKFES